MSKYNYLNLNQKMIKIRKKLPSLMRKRYSEEVDYDFVKLDDINQFLTPAMNRYGVDFEIQRERPTQIDAAGNPVFLTKDGNLWRYEADLEICWINADYPEERTTAILHLIGTNDVADKAKGAAMTYGLKYYLLNKFNIAQNGDEDPDMRGKKTEKEKQGKEAEPAEKGPNAKQKAATVEKTGAGYISQAELEEGLGGTSADRKNGYAQGKMVRSGNAVSSIKEETLSDEKKSSAKIQQLMEGKEETKVSKEKTAKPQSADDKAGAENIQEEDIVFSDEDETEENTKAESGQEAGDGFRTVKDEDEIPFSDEQEEAEEDGAYSEDDKVEKAKEVVCNFGLYKGKTLGELLQTPKGWESLKWIATRYNGGNMQMKEAAKVLVEADAYMPDAA